AAQPPQTAANTAKPAAAAEKPAPAKGGYVLQVGLYKSRENAQRSAASLKKAGYPAMIATSASGAFSVRVGPYADRAEAERMQAKLLRETGDKPLIQSR
ncbi:MAG TPA: SPOR domain-containing protein, partial [Vicinamibacterales bacterium]|nr:SPOR domain-containing protein [Vicinamibacterales bacterium]